MRVRNDPPAPANFLDAEIIRRRLRVMTLPITNADRAVGAGVAGHIARHRICGTDTPVCASTPNQHRQECLCHKPVRLSFHGAAGQSFGAFCVDGMRLELDGVANDGVGKGMSGGEIVIRQSRIPDAVLAGNAILYGATGGRLFIAGRVGERFAVRNSGASAIVEGAGDHACEYMTAGVVVILGPTGVNAGAGMTGGTLFVAGEPSINTESVAALALSPSDESLLRDLLVAHRFATGSERARVLLEDWPNSRLLFRRVVPIAAIQAEEEVIVRTTSC
jgi:glutamate synthase domain-containing protein 3